jgi:hypothetical protein
MPTITKKDFRKAITNFRKEFGQRSFWEGNNPKEAVEQLSYIYLTAVDLEECDLNVFTATMSEYDTRLLFAISSGMYKEKA